MEKQAKPSVFVELCSEEIAAILIISLKPRSVYLLSHLYSTIHLSARKLIKSPESHCYPLIASIRYQPFQCGLQQISFLLAIRFNAETRVNDSETEKAVTRKGELSK
jgi:hypothetical protein